MDVLFVFATETESRVLQAIPGIKREGERYILGVHKISVLLTSVGGISTAWAMKQWLSCNANPDLAVNAGIAGSFSDRFRVGDVVIPVTDCFADMGLEQGGRFVTLAEAGFIDPDEFPYNKGLLKADNEYVEKALELLPGARAVTVNTATGSDVSICRLINKFNPEIETMEGATFFYICLMEKIPFLPIRAISNKIEPASRSSWNITLALENLGTKLNDLLLTIV